MSVVENNVGTRGRPFQAGRPNPGFKPGQSGNPGGRPKGLARRVRDEIGADGGELVEIMLEIARDLDASRRDRMQAVEWLAVRGWGRAPDVDPELKLFPSSVDLDKLTLAELDALFELVTKASLDK